MRWWGVLLCTRPTCLVEFFHIASSLKQQSMDRHVAQLGHIILIPSQPVFALSPKCCVLSGEATNTNFIFIGLTGPGLEPTIYHTWGEHANHYTTNAVVNKTVHVQMYIYQSVINERSGFRFLRVPIGLHHDI